MMSRQSINNREVICTAMFKNMASQAYEFSKLLSRRHPHADAYERIATNQANHAYETAKRLNPISCSS